MDGMNKALIILVISTIFILSIIFNYANETVVADTTLPKYYVDDDFNATTPGWQTDHFDTIQDAINAAENGDRIIVYEGTYQENIIINKSIALFGEDVDEVIIDGGNRGSIVTVTVANVDFSTFTIQHSGTNASDAAIKLTSSSGTCQIVENKITSSNYGLYVDRCHNTIFSQNYIYETTNATFFISSNSNTIEYNTIYDNKQHGIFLNKTCQENIIQKNIVHTNGWYGIYLNDNCSDNTISENVVYRNENTGIRIEDDVQTTTISENTVYENENYGIFIVGSNTQISENSVYLNGKHGVFLFADDNSSVTLNNVSSNIYEGIRLQNSTDTVITSNVIYENQRFGVYVNYYSTQNLIYNNMFKGNEEHAKDISKDTSGNKWNISNVSSSNIIHGPYLGGNYWDDYNGTEWNRTGLGSQPYPILGGNKYDLTPLVFLRPVAHDGGPYDGSVNENIVFDASASYNIDETINLTGYYWVFGDGTSSSGETSTHNFSEPGNYTVRLTVENEIGGTDTDYTYVIITPDLVAPSIDVETHELVVTDSSTLYTLRVHVKDNVAVHNVTLKYWFDNSTDRIITHINDIGNNRYEKTIIHSAPVENLFCIVTARDISNNINTTENPFAVISCKNTVNLSESVTFDGTNSFDLDGSIQSYSWNFGDGVIEEEAIAEHSYTADGTYLATLTVIDNEGNEGRCRETIVVSPPEPISTGEDTLELINTRGDMNIALSESFRCYDTNGDGDMDMFIDPNGVLTSVLTPLNINGEVAFLLSVDDDDIPEFFWTPESDRIQWISYSNPTVSDDDVDIDYNQNQAILTVSIDKSGWIIIDIADTLYPEATIKEVYTANNEIISSNQIWRINDHIYILDDPSTTYSIVFENIIPSIEVTFTPGESGVIDESNPSILIEYNIPVVIDYAFFNTYEATDDLIQIDEQTYQYTPPGYLKNGTYVFEIQSHAVYGDQTDVSSSTYFYFQYQQPPQPSFIEQYGLIVLIIGIILGGGLFYMFSRYMGYSFTSYIYIKNRRILPFIRPIVLGPLSVSVDEENISKAEFYVDGELKQTISHAPFAWQWSDSAFLKHRIEAKVFDKSGKSMSSGEMSVFMFNPFSINPSLMKDDSKKQEETQ